MTYTRDEYRSQARRYALTATAFVLFMGLGAQTALGDWWGRGEKVRGSGKLAEETRELSGFTSITVKNSTDIDILVGEKFSVILEADDNILELIETEVRRGNLLVTTADGYSIRARRGSKLTITMPKLEGLEIRGSSDIRAQGIKSERLHIEIRGSGDIDLSGTADEIEIDIEGSGDIDAKGLKAGEAEIYISGSGDVKLSVKDNLHADIRGSGDITYYGNPKVRKHIRGSGDISKR